MTRNAGQRFRPDAANARLSGQTVLITGAGGSIGSVIAELVSRTAPDVTLAVLDHDDTLLDSVLQRCSAHAGSLVPVLADIRDTHRITEVFADLRPTVVVHAAALKHVHLLELFAEEAIATNVRGTLNVLEAAAGSGSRFFLNISTDKAVGPASVLGQTKLVSERLVSWFGSAKDLHTASARLCNVLGSRGSILPKMADAINEGRPMPITHPGISRYFLLPHDVLGLLAHALSAGESGLTFVPKLRRPTHIVDMIAELESALGIEVKIDIVGLRPGEVLSESLWDPAFETVVSEADGCVRVRVPPLDPPAARSITAPTLRAAATARLVAAS